MLIRALNLLSRKFTSTPPIFHEIQTVSIYNPISFIDEAVNTHKILLFMKGTPNSPKCGFSKAVVSILNHYNLSSYHFINVLENSVIREEVKKYSDWPTFPQLYINSELIGGCDILTEMHKNDSLKEVFSKHGLISKD
jgi:monothiol glutaredoxin